MGLGDVLLVLDPAGPGLTLVRGFPWGLTWSQGQPSAHAPHSLTPDEAMWQLTPSPMLRCKNQAAQPVTCGPRGC